VRAMFIAFERIKRGPAAAIRQRIRRGQTHFGVYTQSLPSAKNHYRIRKTVNRPPFSEIFFTSLTSTTALLV